MQFDRATVGALVAAAAVLAGAAGLHFSDAEVGGVTDGILAAVGSAVGVVAVVRHALQARAASKSDVPPAA